MDTFSTRRFYRARLFLYTLVIVVLGAGLAGAGAFLLFPAQLGEGYGAVLSTVQDLEQVLLVKVGMIYAIMSIFIIVAVVLLHLFYSHRIAGPAYRLGREARVIGQGGLKGNIRFRQKDNLTDMADSLNQVASRYQGRISSVKENLSQIETQAESIASLVSQGKSGDAIEQTADELKANLKNVERTLSEMRV